MPHSISIDQSAPSMLTKSTIYALTEHISSIVIIYVRPPTLLCQVDSVGSIFSCFPWHYKVANYDPQEKSYILVP